MQPYQSLVYMAQVMMLDLVFELALKRSSAGVDMAHADFDDAAMKHLCYLQVTTTGDAAAEHTHFILQPMRISDGAEKHQRHVHDMSADDAAVKHLC